MREDASVEQLLANIEGRNAEFIQMGLVQSARLTRLNEIAIRQLQVFTAHSVSQVLRGDQTYFKLLVGKRRLG